jgi:hypothetical protein
VSDPHGEFRHEVEYLADRAAEERSRVAASSKPLLTHKPVRRFLWIGGLVALSQVLLFAYLTYEEQRQIAGRTRCSSSKTAPASVTARRGS